MNSLPSCIPSHFPLCFFNSESFPQYQSNHTVDVTPQEIILCSYFLCGPGSSVGIATDYGLDGPGLNPGGDEIFRSSRPALGPTQPPVNGYRVFPGGKVRPGHGADPPTHI